MKRYFEVAVVTVVWLLLATALSAAGGSIIATAKPSATYLKVGQPVSVVLTIDASGMAEPDNRLGSFSGNLTWDPTVLTYKTHTAGPAGYMFVVNNTQAGAGWLRFVGANAQGATGLTAVTTITFQTIKAGPANLRLTYDTLSAARTFVNLLPFLTLKQAMVNVQPVWPWGAWR